MTTPRHLPPATTERPVQLPDNFLLSVLVPVFNEENTLEKIIARVREIDIPMEIIMVDDCSTDGTREIMKKYEGQSDIKIYYHPRNRGKGAGLRTAIDHISGTHVIIQDADLEYDPGDYPVLLRPILEGKGDVVYGSRFLGERRVFLFSHYIGNRMLTLITNILYGSQLTDMETCYKCFRREVFDKVKLRSERFNIEPEITAKILKNKFKVFEVPIHYNGRDFDEGKKITWRDGFSAIWALVKFRFID